MLVVGREVGVRRDTDLLFLGAGEIFELRNRGVDVGAGECDCRVVVEDGDERDLQAVEAGHGSDAGFDAAASRRCENLCR